MMNMNFFTRSALLACGFLAFFAVGCGGGGGSSPASDDSGKKAGTSDNTDKKKDTSDDTDKKKDTSDDTDANDQPGTYLTMDYSFTRPHTDDLPRITFDNLQVQVDGKSTYETRFALDRAKMKEWHLEGFTFSENRLLIEQGGYIQMTRVIIRLYSEKGDLLSVKHVAEQQEITDEGGTLRLNLGDLRNGRYIRIMVGESYAELDLKNGAELFSKRKENKLERP